MTPIAFKLLRKRSRSSGCPYLGFEEASFRSGVTYLTVEYSQLRLSPAALIVFMCLSAWTRRLAGEESRSQECGQCVIKLELAYHRALNFADLPVE